MTTSLADYASVCSEHSRLHKRKFETLSLMYREDQQIGLEPKKNTNVPGTFGSTIPSSTGAS
jgi:hypothetical protein